MGMKPRLAQGMEPPADGRRRQPRALVWLVISDRLEMNEQSLRLIYEARISPGQEPRTAREALGDTPPNSLVKGWDNLRDAIDALSRYRDTIRAVSLK